MAGQNYLPINTDNQTLTNVFQFLKHKNLKETEEALKRELGLASSGLQSSISQSTTCHQPDEVEESYSKVQQRADSTSEPMTCHEDINEDINDSREEEEEEEGCSTPGTPHNPTYFVYPTVTTQPAPIRAAPNPPPPLIFKPQMSPNSLPIPTLYTVIPPGLIGGVTTSAPQLINPFFPSSVVSSPVNTTTTSLIKPTSTCVTTTSSNILQSPTNFSQKNAATLASIPPEEMTPTHHELKRFAEEFKAKRIQLGYTQGAVGLSLSEKGYSNFAQSTISRFEQMQLSPSNASAIMVVLKRWLYEAENPDAVSSTSADPLGPPRKRKKRVVYTPQSLKILNKWFEDEPRPNRQIIETVAQELDLQPEEVRVWFCNKRQKQKMSGNDIDDDCDELSPAARSTPSPPQTKFTIEELSKSSSSSTTTNLIASPLSFSSQLTVSPTLRPMIFSTNSRHSVNLPYNFMSTKA